MWCFDHRFCDNWKSLYHHLRNAYGYESYQGDKNAYDQKRFQVGNNASEHEICHDGNLHSRDPTHQVKLDFGQKIKWEMKNTVSPLPPNLCLHPSHVSLPYLQVLIYLQNFIVCRFFLCRQTHQLKYLDLLRKR